MSRSHPHISFKRYQAPSEVFKKSLYFRRGALASFQTEPEAPKMYCKMRHQLYSSKYPGGGSVQNPVHRGRQGNIRDEWKFYQHMVQASLIMCNPSEHSLRLAVTPLICTCLSVFSYVSCLGLEHVACHSRLPMAPKGQLLLSSHSLCNLQGSIAEGGAGLYPSPAVPHPVTWCGSIGRPQ